MTVTVMRGCSFEIMAASQDRDESYIMIMMPEQLRCEMMRRQRECAQDLQLYGVSVF